MAEVRRFLRYTLPGLASVILFIIALSLTDRYFVSRLFFDKDSSQSASMVLTLFLGSGALGYLFANIYFSLYWSWPFRYLAIDHRSPFICLEDKIEILDSSGNKYQKEELTKRDAWTILTQFWHSRIKNNNNKELQGVNLITDRLTDVTHGLGATYIGSIVAFASWIAVHINLSPDATWVGSKEISVSITWLILIFLLSVGYRRVHSALQSIANSTVTSILQKEFVLNKGLRVQIYYVK